VSLFLLVFVFVFVGQCGWVVVVVVVGGRLPDDYNFAVRTGTRTSAGAFAIEFIVRNI
jgi:hypothetical protein